MKSAARTIVLTDKGLQAVREMRALGAVPAIPEWGWPRPKPVRIPRTPGERDQAIAKAGGRDLFLSPAFVLPGDRLMRIGPSGERLYVGTVTCIEHDGSAYRLRLTNGAFKTVGEKSAVLVKPKGGK